jgi:dTDP-4-amino-4,6-dideoxygalactose transaminase
MAGTPSESNKLAIFGGPKAKTTPYGTGKRFNGSELRYLQQALEQNTLFYYHGQMTNHLLDRFKNLTKANFASAVSSGTAAIHVALGAGCISYGDEVILPPITDAGTIIGILAQNALPIFCDIDPNSYLMTPELTQKKLTPRTKAIIVVHLAGNSCCMDGYMKLAQENHLLLVEDCAQAWGATFKNQSVGTFGDFGCFSLNDFKHIGCGDGGIVSTRYEYLYRSAHVFADKYYDRMGTGFRTPASWLGFNYRITELQSAVALAQLEKLDKIVNRRHESGMKLLNEISSIPGLIPQKIAPESYSSFWFTGFRVDEKAAGVTTSEFVNALQAEGIDTSRGYFSLLECDLFLKRQGYRGTTFPFDFPDGRTYEYHTEDCPNADLFMKTFIRLPVNEFHTDEDIEQTIWAIKKVVNHYQEAK